MSKIRSVLDVGFSLIQDGNEYPMAVGSEVELVIAGPCGEDVTVSGIVAGCEIGAARTLNTFGRIYDGVPTYRCGTDTMANIKNVADHYEVEKILVDVSAEDAENPEYKVIAVDKIVAINGTYVTPDGEVVTPVATVEALTEAISAGGTVSISENIDAPTAIPVTVDTKIQLNGKELTVTEDTDGSGVFKVTGGTMTIDGEGIINGVGKNDWNMAIWVTENGKAVINGGMFTNEGATANVDPQHFDLIYASGNGQIEINGGEFKCQTPAWVLNVKDADRATAGIVVKGGRFYGFDPSNCASEGPNTNFVAAGYKSVEVEPGVFEVMVDESYVPPVEEETPAEE